MVFQKPNPFPKSIYDNVAYGPRLGGVRKRADLDVIVERSLRKAALWDEVKDRLKTSAMGMSGGQQQRLCIARAIAVDPAVLLMDEPCSALDPIATARIEDLMREIRSEFTIVIVTHNMAQAARVSDHTAFFTTEVSAETDTRTGVLVEFGTTSKIFSNPPICAPSTTSPADSADVMTDTEHRYEFTTRSTSCVPTWCASGHWSPRRSRRRRPRCSSAT